MAAFEPVDTKASFPELEREILAFWKEHDVFNASLARREGAPLWMFFEGPPTANGRPGVHHVEPRTFKDVYPRFKTMTGHLVPRKGGWDCHGLPVELEVEKEIGTTGKRDIEAFGIAEFNQRCRESVQRYVGEFERLTERIGYWVDLDEAYWTMSPELHRVRVVVAEVAVRAGPAAGSGQGHGVLPPLRHRPVRCRGRAGVPDRRRPERARAVPDRRGGRRRARGRLDGRVDHDTVDPAFEHRGRGRCRRRLCRDRPRRRAPDRRRHVAGDRARRGR